jgi:hypothetical protein
MLSHHRHTQTTPVPAQEARVQPRQQDKIERKSRYISQLKEQAEKRKWEEVGEQGGGLGWGMGG